MKWGWETFFLMAAIVSLLVHTVLAWRGLKERRGRGFPLGMAGMIFALVFQTLFLYLRGETLGRCPLTNMGEVLIFVGWVMLLFYFIFGVSYRLSLLGLFSAPVVIFFNTAAFFLKGEHAVFSSHGSGFHAAISLVAYGAFALASIAGVMFLLQDTFLKKHVLGNLFYSLPPVTHLMKALWRLQLVGFSLFTFGLALSLQLKQSVGWEKIAFVLGIWLVYAVLLFLFWRKSCTNRQFAWASIVAFIMPLGSFFVLHQG